MMRIIGVLLVAVFFSNHAAGNDSLAVDDASSPPEWNYAGGETNFCNIHFPSGVRSVMISLDTVFLDKAVLMQKENTSTGRFVACTGPNNINVVKNPGFQHNFLLPVPEMVKIVRTSCRKRTAAGTNIMKCQYPASLR